MNRLRSERERRGWSQHYLGTLAGLAQSDISAIECGRRGVGPVVRQRLARAVGLPESELFTSAETQDDP